MACVGIAGRHSVLWVESLRCSWSGKYLCLNKMLLAWLWRFFCSVSISFLIGHRITFWSRRTLLAGAMSTGKTCIHQGRLSACVKSCAPSDLCGQARTCPGSGWSASRVSCGTVSRPGPGYPSKRCPIRPFDHRTQGGIGRCWDASWTESSPRISQHGTSSAKHWAQASWPSTCACDASSLELLKPMRSQ